ncbi:MAG: anti-sigma factor [Gemmatimonadaceae bacterium]
MSEPMLHDAARELLAMAALDALAPSERAALEAHTVTCAECTSDLTALRDGVASLASSLPRKPMAPERDSLLRARLMARAVADRPDISPMRGSETPSRSASPSSGALMRWLAAASLLIAAGSIAYAIDQHASAHELAADVAQLRDSSTTMQTRLAEQLAIVAELTGPGVRVIDAAATGGAQPYARMFWEQPTNHWTFVAHNLPAPQPGHTYQLWMITRDSRKLSAGTFVPTANGSALVRTTYALASDSLAAIAVTNEPSGGSAQPTTTPFLVGAAKTD